MTNMLDIYEAAGGEVNEDRSQVSLAVPAKPFKIELLVVPTGIESSGEYPDEVTFAVLLDDEYVIDERVFGGGIMTKGYLTSLKLPVTQVKIIKEDS